MSKISLYQYHEQIESLMDESRLTEAVAHCRHILEQKPRHIVSYRLLGKALLEQQKYTDAIDIFQRVLSADPEDFISHVGLAISYKADQLIPLATWHMERAFEIDPYNAVVQDELKGLYKDRDGIQTERLVLTEGALARLQCRSEMYSMANAGIRQILAQDDSRVDMQTLLAESLWRDDQRVDAVEVCLDVLEKLPNCINANAILAEVWLLTGRESEATPYIERLQQLTLVDSGTFDLESPTGRAFSSGGSFVVPEQIFVTELDEVPFAYNDTNYEEAGADWVVELDDMDGSADESEMDWFGAGTDSLFDDDMDGAFDGDAPVKNAGIEEVPAWLREISGEMDMPEASPPEEIDVTAYSEEEIENVETGFADDVPQWLEDAVETESDLPESDALDWFSDIDTDSLPPEPTGRKAESTGFTDWLTQQDSADELDFTPPDEADLALNEILQSVEEPEEESLPDWLQTALDVEPTVLPDAKPEPVSTEDTLTESSEGAELDEFPDWLGTLEVAEKPDLLATDNEMVSTAIPSAEEPDWLDELGIDDSFPKSAEGDIADLDDVFDDVLIQTGDISGLLDDAASVTSLPSETGDLDTDPLLTKDELMDNLENIDVADLEDGGLMSWLDELGDHLTYDSDEESDNKSNV